MMDSNNIIKMMYQPELCYPLGESNSNESLFFNENEENLFTWSPISTNATIASSVNTNDTMPGLPISQQQTNTAIWPPQNNIIDMMYNFNPDQFQTPPQMMKDDWSMVQQSFMLPHTPPENPYNIDLINYMNYTIPYAPVYSAVNNVQPQSSSSSSTSSSRELTPPSTISNNISTSPTSYFFSQFPQQQQQQQQQQQIVMASKPRNYRRKSTGSTPTRTYRRRTSSHQSVASAVSLSAHEPIARVINGIEHISFLYSHDRNVQSYTVRTDVNSVNLDDIPIDFRVQNAIYPRANVSREEYDGNRWEYETTCNMLGWKLCWLNQNQLCGRRGLIQRAVDSYRNRHTEMRSRRVTRQEKVANGTLRKRRAKKAMSTLI